MPACGAVHHIDIYYIYVAFRETSQTHHIHIHTENPFPRNIRILQNHPDRDFRKNFSDSTTFQNYISKITETLYPLPFPQLLNIYIQSALHTRASLREPAARDSVEPSSRKFPENAYTHISKIFARCITQAPRVCVHLRYIRRVCTPIKGIEPLLSSPLSLPLSLHVKCFA